MDGLKGVCVCRKGKKSVRTQRGSLTFSPAVTSNLDLSYLFTHLTPYYRATVETHESSSAGLKSLIPRSSLSYRLNIQTDYLLHLLDRIVQKSQKRGTHAVLPNEEGLKRFSCNVPGTSIPRMYVSLTVKYDKRCLEKIVIFLRNTCCHCKYRPCVIMLDIDTKMNVT